jgi:hypothetical protein
MAAPGTEKTDQASKAESPKAESPKGPGAPAAKAGAAPEAPGAKPAPQGKPAPRKGRPVLKLSVSALVLAALAAGAGYAALTFRNVDPRIDVAASYVDEGLREAHGLLDKGRSLVGGLTGGAAKPDAAPNGAQALLEKAPLEEQPSPAVPAEPEKSAELPPPAPEPRQQQPAAATPDEARTAETKPVETPSAEVKPVETPAPAASTEARPQEPKALEPAEPPAAKPPEAKSIDAKSIDAKPAAAAAPAAKEADLEGFSDRDLIFALVGQIDALSDEVKALRERLDAPKNETRAAPEAVAPKPASVSAAAPDASGAAVVLAFAVQRELEAGRPFAEEIAAYARLGAEPSPAPALTEFAEKGAPTGAQLGQAFQPVAKSIRAHENHAGQESGALTEHLLQGASKLVKVRPTGEAEPESLEGKLHRIEMALTHNDFAAALSLYDSLPEPAREDSKDFGATLRQRVEAARAADDLLHGAIAALGKK